MNTPQVKIARDFDTWAAIAEAVEAHATSVKDPGLLIDAAKLYREIGLIASAQAAEISAARLAGGLTL